MALTQDQINNARSRLDNKKYETTMKFGLMGKPPKKVKPSDDQPGMLSSVADWAVNLFSSDEVKPTPQASASIWDNLPPPPSVDLVTEGFMSRQRTFAPEADAAELTRPRLGSELGNSPTTQNNAPAYDGAVLSALGVRTSGDATPIINTAPAAEPVAASDAAPSVSQSIGIMSKPSSAEQEINIPKEGSASTISKLSKLEKPNDDTEYLVKSEGIYAPAAQGYSKASIKSYSNYNTPLEETGIRGNSRIGGDASPEVQEASIKAIIKYGKQFGMTKDQLAYTLATARVESGFNPDAAAGTTSASGLGQFTKETGDSYGLNDTNRFDLDTNAQALVLHTLDNYDLARRRKKPDSYVYKYHHDGASGEYGGLAVYNSKVKPSISIYKALLDENGYKPSGTPMDRQLAVDNLNSPLSLQKSPRPKPRPNSVASNTQKVTSALAERTRRPNSNQGF